MPGDQRVTTGGRFALDIMGANAGVLRKFEGLDMAADIVTNDLGPAGVQKKQVANVRWTPARATVGIGIGKTLYAVIQRAFQASPKAFDGSLKLADFNYKLQSSLNFTGAVLTSVTLPALDGSSKEAAYFDLEWEAETVRIAKGDGADIRQALGAAQKAWLASNFRFEMGGLPCERVARIDSFTWKCIPGADPVGEVRKPTAKVTVPNVKVEISMADYDAWAERARTWFIDGKRGENDEMAGAIVFLGPDMKTELGRVSLKGCGFAGFSRGALEAASDSIARFTVEFYVEGMEFTLTNANL